jgi:hypothetical protein
MCLALMSLLPLKLHLVELIFEVQVRPWRWSIKLTREKGRGGTPLLCSECVILDESSIDVVALDHQPVFEPVLVYEVVPAPVVGSFSFT